MQNKKFLDVLQGQTEIDCDLIIGGAEMPATFVWNKSSYVSEYGIEKYRPIMEADYDILDSGNIIIYCDDDRLGAEFCLAAAGYISNNEYMKIFIDKEI